MMATVGLYRLPLLVNLNRLRYHYRYAVPLPVTHRDIRRGVDVRKAEPHFFRGAWYGKDLKSLDTFGKVEGPTRARRGLFMGRISARWSNNGASRYI